MSKMPKICGALPGRAQPRRSENKALWIDYARDDDMKRQMNVIEKKKGVNAILLGIFEEVGAWTSFPTMGVDYLALLLSTHLKRDARFRLTRFLLHNGCNPIRIALWYKTRGMLIDHSARLDVKALLDAFPKPYNPDIKNYHIPGTVSRRTAEPNFERIVDEHRWCTSSLTGGFTYANGIMDDILARAVSILMYNSNTGEAGRFSVPPGDHLSLALGGSTARVEKAIEVYERSRDRFAALTEAPSEPYDGLKWIVDLAMIPPSPPCSPPGSPTPPASPMMDVEEDSPPLYHPPSALSFLADVSGFKAEFDGRTASLQAAVIAAQKERDGADAELSATIDILQGKAVQLGVSFDLATYLEERVELGEGSEQVGLGGDSAHLEERLDEEVAHTDQEGGPILVLNSQGQGLGAKRLAINIVHDTLAGDLGEAQPIRVANKTVLSIVGIEGEVALRLVGDGACFLVHLHSAHPAVPLHKLEAHNRPLL